MALHSDEDYMSLGKLVERFSRNLVNPHDEDAVFYFNKEMRFHEFFSIMAAKARYISSSNNDSIAKATKNYIKYTNKTIPPLKRAFGEAALLNALPAAMRNKDTAEFVEELGGKRIAALIRTSIAPNDTDISATSTPTGKKAQPK